MPSAFGWGNVDTISSDGGAFVEDGQVIWFSGLPGAFDGENTCGLFYGGHTKYDSEKFFGHICPT